MTSHRERLHRAGCKQAVTACSFFLEYGLNAKSCGNGNQQEGEPFYLNKKKQRAKIVTELQLHPISRHQNQVDIKS